jgi:hypothetical protein
MGIEAAKDVKAAGTENIFNKVITKQVQEAFRISNRQDQNKTFPNHSIVETLIY